MRCNAFTKVIALSSGEGDGAVDMRLDVVFKTPTAVVFIQRRFHRLSGDAKQPCLLFIKKEIFIWD